MSCQAVLQRSSLPMISRTSSGQAPYRRARAVGDALVQRASCPMHAATDQSTLVRIWWLTIASSGR